MGRKLSTHVKSCSALSHYLIEISKTINGYELSDMAKNKDD